MSDNHLGSPLHLAAATGDPGEVRKLLHAGSDVNSRDYNNRTPLHIAAAHGNTAALRLLLNAGANTQLEDVDGLTPLNLAVAHGHRLLAERMQKHMLSIRRSRTSSRSL
ncbi:MAG: ankyrin repeat domain-containing protein [Planctomycetia bacterium]|nr:ankyrin repeat domain-containing protein [Planctomycetia bacterium]